MLTVMARKTRYTHDFIEVNSCFTISVPYNKSMNKEIGILGIISSWDVDKISFSKTNISENG